MAVLSTGPFCAKVARDARVSADHLEFNGGGFCRFCPERVTVDIRGEAPSLVAEWGFVGLTPVARSPHRQPGSALHERASPGRPHRRRRPSAGDTTSLGWGEAEVVADLVKAYADDGPVILYGQSMGSAAALRAVGGLGAEAAALILENPYDRLLTTVGHRFEAMGLPAQPGAALLVFWGGLLLGFDGFDMDPVDYATGIRAPTLLLTGEADPRVRPAEVAAIRAQLGGPAELEQFPNAGHVGLLSADPERWRTAVAGFLHRNALGTPSDSNPRTLLSTP